ncbi:MAG: TlpA disulfide reductase family protein [Candidatus Neomarinimicrobiota bacterium]
MRHIPYIYKWNHQLSLIAVLFFTLGFTATDLNAMDTLTLDDLKSVDLEGTDFEGSMKEGQIILVDFWAVWCGPCVKAFPVLNKLEKDFKKQNFQVISVATYSGTVEDIRETVNKFDLNYTILVGDANLIEKFGVIGLPTYFLFDKNGLLYKKYVGEVDNFYDKISDDITALQNLTEDSIAE